MNYNNNTRMKTMKLKTMAMAVLTALVMTTGCSKDEQPSAYLGKWHLTKKTESVQDNNRYYSDEHTYTDEYFIINPDYSVDVKEGKGVYKAIEKHYTIEFNKVRDVKVSPALDSIITFTDLNKSSEREMKVFVTALTSRNGSTVFQKDDVYTFIKK